MEDIDRVTRRGSVLWASLVMLALSLLLSWIPALGPLAAGFVGGRMAGSTRRGLWASVLPALVLATLVVLVLVLFDLPVLGAVAGIGVLVWVLVEDIPMVAGAALGGALAERR